MQLRQEGEHVQGPRPHGRRRPRRSHRRDQRSGVPHPQFEGQTKTKLGNSEVEGIVNVDPRRAYLTKYLEENPRSRPKRWCKKGILAAEARESQPARPANSSATAKARLRRSAAYRENSATALAKTSTSASSTSWKATRPAARAEGGRLREYQAILPLRGKIINAYKFARRQSPRQRRNSQHDLRRSASASDEDLRPQPSVATAGSSS